MSLILACDLGATTFRAALLDPAGRTAAEATAATDLPGGATATEVDPDHWWRLLLQAMEALAQGGAPLSLVRGIALCGLTRTQIFLDAQGRVLRPAITFRDTRAVAEADDLLARVPGNWPERAQLNAFHPAARLAWLAAHEPRALDQLHAVLDPKDYLNFRLTGRMATDSVSGARLRATLAPWPGEGSLAGMIGLPPAVASTGFLLPTEVLGTVQPDLPGALAGLAGRPVFAGANDTWAAVAGLGALRPGLAYNISGTTEVLGVLGTEAVEAPGLLSVDWGPGLQQIGGPSQSGADSVPWLLGLLAGGGAGPAEDGLERLLALPRDSSPALFLPFLQGERVPYWDPNLRGAWLGLNRRHKATDLAYAVLEGLAFLNRTVLGRAEAALGFPVREIRLGGGGAASAAWCRIKADVTNRPIVVGEAAEPGLLGCAMLAWAGLGMFSDLAAAQQALARPARRYEPDPARRDAYEPLHAAWTSAVAALRPGAAELAALRSPS